ncbi:MAG: hypothetical protein M9918_07925 [Anaerolineae bacterium]|nr:hypothetical protein [Anaerolineae bacterium]
MNLEENRWQPQPGELAARIRLRQVQGWLFKEITVESGQRLLLSADGESLPPFGPGRHAVSDIGDNISHWLGLRSAERVTGVIFDCTPFALTFDFDDFYTIDPYQVGIHFTLFCEIDAPARVRDTLMQAHDRLFTADVRQSINDVIKNAVQEWIESRSVAELTTTFGNRDDFAIHLADQSRPTLRELGLRFVRLHALNYRVIQRDHLHAIKAEYVIRQTTLAAELEGEANLFDLLSAQEQLTLRRETEQARQFEQRVGVRERMRQAVLSDEFGRIQAEHDKAAFLRDLDTENRLAEDERARLRQALAWQRADQQRQRNTEQADAEMARAHVLAQIEIENRYDRIDQELRRKQISEPAQLAHERRMARQRLEAEHDEMTLRLSFELAQAHQRNAFDRKQNALSRKEQIDTARIQNTIALEQAQTQAEIDALKLSLEHEEDLHGIEMLTQIKQVQRDDERQQRGVVLDAEERQLAIEMKRREHALALKFAWLERLKGLSPQEMILSANDADRAQLIHNLRQTQVMKGMSPEQIEARMRGNSAEVTEAIDELLRRLDDKVCRQCSWHNDDDANFCAHCGKSL